jgi:hypothetical protein
MMTTDAYHDAAPARLSDMDVILPVGKPGAAKGHSLPEMERFNGRSMIEWAVDEACQAGAARILMVAPEGNANAPALARHLRQTVLTRRDADRDRHPDRPDPHRPRLALLTHPADGPEGWDGLIRAAATRCLGPQALMLDPTIAMTADGRITTFASFMLRRAAVDRGQTAEGAALPSTLLATAELDWEDALSLPVLTEPPALAYHRPGTAQRLTVFAGRALIALPMPAAPPPVDPSALFPGEALTRALIAAGGETLRLLFHPLDLRFGALADPSAPPPNALPFSTRLGLGALQRIA